MISPETNSVDYGDLLKAPKGYRASHAIGTTYSLDLTALMGAYLSLGLSVDTDSALAENDLYLLAALNEMKGKVAVFCEKGRISGARQYKELYSQIEGGIVQVNPKGNETEARRNALPPSFHPKTWLVRYVPQDGQGPIRYRYCVLSRNLTLDGSWDLAASFDGEHKRGNKNRSAHSDAIEKFVATLASMCKGRMPEAVATILGEIDKVLFAAKFSHGFELNLPFLYGGGDRSDLICEMSERIETSDRALVISPFIGNDPRRKDDPLSMISREFTESSNPPLLVTRTSSLLGNAKAVEALSRFAIFAVRTDLLSAEPEAESHEAERAEPQDEEAHGEQRDIHAKLIALRSTEANSERCDLYVGSANATYRGLNLNYEAMAHLVSEEAGAFDALVDELGLSQKKLESGSLFTKLDPEALARLGDEQGADTSKREAQMSFDLFLRQLEATMKVAEAEDGAFDVTVSLSMPGKPNGQHIEIALATMPKICCPADASAKFANVDLSKLTRFILVTSKQEQFTCSRLFKCETKGKAEEYLERQSSGLFKRIAASNQQSFVDYLAFRLSSNPELTAAEASLRRNAGNGQAASLLAGGLYESLLKSFANDPARAEQVISECLKLLNENTLADSPESESVRNLLNAFSGGEKIARKA